MDCSICSAMPFIPRPPRNTICGACYEGARTIITLTNRNDHSDNTKGTDNKTVTGLSASSSNPSIKVSFPFWLPIQSFVCLFFR